MKVYLLMARDSWPTAVYADEATALHSCPDGYEVIAYDLIDPTAPRPMGTIRAHDPEGADRPLAVGDGVIVHAPGDTLHGVRGILLAQDNNRASDGAWLVRTELHFLQSLHGGGPDLWIRAGALRRQQG